jgi:uncharacterized phiE125 gp8 family phage protein
MRVFVVTPPEPVVSLAEAKQQLKVSGTGEDALITGYIAAATETLDGPDGYLGRALGVQTLEARFDVLSPCDRVVTLPFPPVIDLVSVKYLDAAGAERTADNADVELLGTKLVPAGSSFPWEGGSTRAEAVRIQYRAGYQTIPAPVRAAILLMVGDLYRFRETASVVQMSKVPISTPVEDLLGRLRVYR